MITTRRYVAAVVVAALVALAGCDIRTATAPTGDLTLHATFADAQDLTPGHNVQASNVVVGSVRQVTLDGYLARVRMSIADGRRIPTGTRAVIRRTSLLGEYFVDLVFPASFDPEHGPFLADEAVITDTKAQPDVEQLAEKASAIVGALTSDDVAGMVDATATALAGRGATLHRTIDHAAQLTAALAAQDADLAAAIDGIAEIGGALASRDDEIGALVDALASATETVAGSRDRFVAATEALVALASTFTDAVLVPHAERLRTMLAELNPLLGYLADRSDVLAGLVTDLFRFTEAMPKALYHGQVLLLTWAFIDNPVVNGALTGADPLEALGALVRGSQP